MKPIANTQTQTNSMKNNKKQAMGCQHDLLAQRKSCTAEGVGLSHYILMDKKPS